MGHVARLLVTRTEDRRADFADRHCAGVDSFWQSVPLLAPPRHDPLLHQHRDGRR